MLQPKHVLEFSIHSDVAIRELAAQYLTEMEETAPPETADELWRAIGLFGDQQGTLGCLQSPLDQIDQHHDEIVSVLNGRTEPNDQVC